MSAGVDLRDFVATVLHGCLEDNVLGELPKGCEAGYLLADALTAHGVRTTMSRAPLFDQPVLTIDPKRQFGRVCIGGTRITAETIGGMVAAGDSVDSLAEDYEIARDEVLLACLWYQWECSVIKRKWERKVAKAWERWAGHAAKVLGGWEKGPLGDPPSVEG